VHKDRSIPGEPKVAVLFANSTSHCSIVMVGLVPTIHVFFCPPVGSALPRKSWMVGTRPTMTAENGEDHGATGGTGGACPA
jgi:hypothetical protein